ncbi:hypothetical protein SAMN05216582_12848 [Selenomonas ruminantium]|uniref:Uncharacterized protein n=1 Tax=Selenomonas ruminantium TaxID=971 RepID=A0A1M6WVK7_SELRU|nr:hypothetical protein [Selenomonas ruminantium]SHK97802.1 hypothetical protein SAMN05216582_12848 [Selenomonas ruminantium]
MSDNQQRIPKFEALHMDIVSANESAFVSQKHRKYGSKLPINT